MAKASTSAEVYRFSAMLLFQFRIVENEEVYKRRLCEKRLIIIESSDGKKALKEAKRRGKAAQHSYRNNTGGMVHIEFIGILDLLKLGKECEPDEVWYKICKMNEPMERKDRILPHESELSAIIEYERVRKLKKCPTQS